jgi:hypothetical protein
METATDHQAYAIRHTCGLNGACKLEITQLVTFVQQTAPAKVDDF